MIESTADFIQKWRADCAILDRKIASLQTGLEGMYLSAAEREVAIRKLVETVTDMRSLIDNFDKFEAFPTSFGKAVSHDWEFVDSRCDLKIHAQSELASA